MANASYCLLKNAPEVARMMDSKCIPKTLCTSGFWISIEQVKRTKKFVSKPAGGRKKTQTKVYYFFPFGEQFNIPLNLCSDASQYIHTELSAKM